MKSLRDFITITNLNTNKSTIIDSEGNIESPDDFGGADMGLRPDGSRDDLDDFDGGMGQLGDFGDFADFGELGGLENFGDGGDVGLRPDGSNDGFDEQESDPYAENDIGLRPDGSRDEFDDFEDSSLPGAQGDDEFALGMEDGEHSGSGFETEEGAAEEEVADPDFQGVIRTVKGACLVYKRKDEGGTFEELWIYNVGKNMRNEVKTRRAILAGTDIPQHGVTSEDGSQNVESKTIGNVQFLKITGLPN